MVKLINMAMTLFLIFVRTDTSFNNVKSYNAPLIGQPATSSI